MTSYDLRSAAIQTVRNESDQRAHPRTTVFTSLTLVHNAIELTDCHALNISNTGICIRLSGEADLSIGDLISLRLHIWTGNDHLSRFLHAKLIRSGQRILAASIIDHSRIANAVMQDILYYQQLERRNTARTGLQRLSFSANLSAWIARLIS